MFGTKDDFGLKLYARKVLIKENFKDLLPNYLRFVEGVVDSEDIPLNVSREMVQATPVIEKIKSTLVRRLSGQLNQLADEEPEKYGTFWQEFGPFIKEGIATEPEAKEKFVDLLRFTSSKSDSAKDLVSLKQYVDRMQPDQTEIYYILGDDYNVLSRSPHLEYFRKHDIEVLYLTDPLDSFLLIGLTEYDEKPLKNIDDAGLDLPVGEEDEAKETAEQAISSDDFEKLVARFKDVLGERVEDVVESKILSDSPARLVNPKDALNANIQRVQRLLDKDYQIPKKILEINRKHELIQGLSVRLATSTDDPLINALIEQLYANELVTEGIHPNPAEMVTRIYELMEAAART
jgi:molecular chaperone HtpG